MGMGRIGVLVFVAIASALATYFYIQLEQRDVQRCDIHPHISAAGLKALRNNLDRVRTATYNATLADTKDQESAYKAGEKAAEDQFIDDLRNSVGEEYVRHRRAMDNCF